MLMIVSVLSLRDWICSEARAKVTENGRLMLAAKLMLVCLAILGLLEKKKKKKRFPLLNLSVTPTSSR